LFLVELCDFLAGDTDLPGIGHLQANEQFQKDALSASTAAENGNGLAARNLKIHSIQHFLVSKCLTKVLNRYCRILIIAH